MRSVVLDIPVGAALSSYGFLGYNGKMYPLGDALWLMNHEDITVYAGTVRVSKTNPVMRRDYMTFDLSIAHAWESELASIMLGII